MKTYQVFITDTAFNDMNDIINYIANELFEPHVAEKLLGTFQDAINSLSDVPHRHKIVELAEIMNKTIRMFPIENYIIFYAINEKVGCVDIVRVLYGRRNWKFLF